MSDPSLIKVSLNRLVQIMRDKGMKTPSHLSRGLTRQEILDLTRNVVALPEEVIALYEFTDGTHLGFDYVRRDSSVEIMYGYLFLPLRDALKEHARFITEAQVYRPDWIAETREDVTGWLPILASGSDMYFIDCNRAAADKPCIFWSLRPHDPDLAYTGLQTMLDTIIACYEQNAFIVKNGKITNYDHKKEKEITRQYNQCLDA